MLLYTTFISLFITTSILNVRAQTNTTNFQREAVQQHNYRRQLHCVPLLALNSTLNTIAQNYANHLASNNLFVHSGAPGLGENLWAISSSGTLGIINGSRPTESWYSEISLYNFSAPGFSSGTGHFTQVIWRASTQLGVGIAFSSNNQRAVVVANYFPAGNVIGAFATNVPPLCANPTSSTSSMTTVVSSRPITSTSSAGVVFNSSMGTIATGSSSTTDMSGSTVSVPEPVSVVEFREQIIWQHNFRRRLHCVGDLVMNASMNTVAQRFAEYLAANNVFNHSGMGGVGENLWGMSVSGALGYVHGALVVESWYGSGVFYNYSLPIVASTSKDFTQLIWRASQGIGIGVAFSNDRRFLRVVVQYYPAGNIAGQFTANVPRVCSTTTIVPGTG